MLTCIILTIVTAALMIGLDPTGQPMNKNGLLFAAYLSNTFGAVRLRNARLLSETLIFPNRHSCSYLHGTHPILQATAKRW